MRKSYKDLLYGLIWETRLHPATYFGNFNIQPKL
jgi:hypothetical protein